MKEARGSGFPDFMNAIHFEKKATGLIAENLTPENRSLTFWCSL